MEIIQTPLKDCVIIKTKQHGDERGFFLESFNQRELSDNGVVFEVRQINFAKSQRNVLRGLHFQRKPMEQAKIVGVISGAVLDVVVDMRKESPTYLKHFKLKIDSPEVLLMVPRGFAHGYHTLLDNTVFYYAVDNFYSPENEGGILYNDGMLGIDWELKGSPIVSEKDLNHNNL